MSELYEMQSAASTPSTMDGINAACRALAKERDQANARLTVATNCIHELIGIISKTENIEAVALASVAIDRYETQLREQ